LQTSIRENYQHINVLHLRNGDDAVDFWSRINRMNFDEFKITLENKYINLIQNYLSNDPNHITIILSALPNGNVIDYLKNNNYNYIFLDKNIFKERELNAILDIIMCKMCNHVLICNYNPQLLVGSTFSYLLSTMVSTDCKKITIDLDHIADPEYIL
jgi:hypothetical protein